MSRMDLINRLELIFEHKFSPSQIEKDIFSLKMEFDAPIKYDYDLRAYKMIEEYDFKEALYNFIDVWLWSTPPVQPLNLVSRVFFV